jgi:tRNA(Ile2) C34 agmatinyltransferase TiaS
MSIHLCPRCANHMSQVGPHEEWRFHCPACGARWHIGKDGLILRIIPKQEKPTGGT